MSKSFADALISGGPDVILVLDRSGGIVHANPAARRFCGDGIEGRNFCELLDEFSVDKGLSLLERSWVEGGVTDWELDHVGPGNARVLISYTTYVLQGEGAPLLAAVGRDQTAKLELAARLAAANRQLEGALLALERAHADLKLTQAQLVQSEKMRALGQMVAGVAHEINNPASFVSNNLVYLATVLPPLRGLFDAYQPLRQAADPDQRAALEAAEAQAEVEHLWGDLADVVSESQDGIRRIRDIVILLRNFARLDEAEQKDADINAGLRNTLILVRPLCKQRIQIHESYGELPLVLCRPGQLNQVFLNLLMNAVQAITDEGEIWVSSACQNGRVRVTTRDNGNGMDAATLVRLGEPFFTMKPLGSGTGLGLAVSFGIVERHNGKICFESQPGQGTTVTVELPVVR